MGRITALDSGAVHSTAESFQLNSKTPGANRAQVIAITTTGDPAVAPSGIVGCGLDWSIADYKQVTANVGISVWVALGASPTPGAPVVSFPSGSPQADFEWSWSEIDSVDSTIAKAVVQVKDAAVGFLSPAQSLGVHLNAFGDARNTTYFAGVHNKGDINSETAVPSVGTLGEIHDVFVAGEGYSLALETSFSDGYVSDPGATWNGIAGAIGVIALEIGFSPVAGGGGGGVVVLPVGKNDGFILDHDEPDVGIVKINSGMHCLHVDQASGRLYFVATDEASGENVVYAWDSLAERVPYLRRSKKFILPNETNFGAARIIAEWESSLTAAEVAAYNANRDAIIAANELILAADDSGTINGSAFNEIEINGDILQTVPPALDDIVGMVFKLYADGVLVVSRTVTDDKPFRLPPGYLAKYVEIELQGQIEAQEVRMATSIMELADA
jgi:hypothetical protein